jgi:hypothetical protein
MSSRGVWAAGDKKRTEMRVLPPPRRHLFVCANRREGSPLGPGCGDRGEEVYESLKLEVARRGEVNTTWITRTHCLGVCPAEGTTVACRGADGAARLLTEVTTADVGALLAPPPDEARPSIPEELTREIDALEDLQRRKVLDLARRLKPGLTLEDVQNPHDFPELDDPDWHYADGVLTGIQTVKSVVLALRQARREGGG